MIHQQPPFCALCGNTVHPKYQPVYAEHVYSDGSVTRVVIGMRPCKCQSRQQVQS